MVALGLVGPENARARVYEKQPVYEKQRLRNPIIFLWGNGPGSVTSGHQGNIEITSFG